MGVYLFCATYGCPCVLSVYLFSMPIYGYPFLLSCLHLVHAHGYLCLCTVYLFCSIHSYLGRYPLACIPAYICICTYDLHGWPVLCAA